MVNDLIKTAVIHRTSTAAAKKKLRRFAKPYLMILPAMAGLAVFYLYPVFGLIRFSFFRYNILNEAMSKFVGLQNYTRMFQDADFYKVLINTVIYTICVVVFTTVISMFLAIWLNKGSVVNKLVQAGLFTPHIISMVSVALVWMWIMNPDQGLLNAALRAAGLPTPLWLTSSQTALLSIIIVSVWKSVGYYTLMLIAALQSIPTSILEAAQLDNAKGFHLYFRIVLPLISPHLFFILVTMTIGSFKVFDMVQVMTGGGPDNATNTLMYYLYQFRSTRVGYASAVGVVIMALIGLLTWCYFRSLSKRVYYQ
ncbi:MAG: sugar ABC transporter permease [Ethanoligenens sp.]|uniref:carbohydrate ABC transporter permease n=1 Tax=Ethanoligenens sp. TaxID=2099655 RepID=UPI0039E9D695